jgi:hypothetical protein
MIRFAESAEDMNQIPSMAIIAYDDEAGQTQFNIFVDQAASDEMASPPGGMQGWMRSMNIRAAVIVDVATLTLELFAKIGDVMREQERREQQQKPARK